MILKHNQSRPEITYKGCVICFLEFDGEIDCVGTRLADLTVEEFMTFKTLVNMIEFEIDEPDYSEMIKLALDRMESCCISKAPAFALLTL